jgi:hypothetical protein
MTDIPAQAQLRDITWGWWLVVLVGVLSILAGVIILAQPASSLATLAVIAGIFLLLDGILELIASFMRSTTNRGLVALLGVLTAVVGVLLIRHPVGGVTAVALLIGIWLIATGVIRPGGRPRADRRHRDRREPEHRLYDPGHPGRHRLHPQRHRTDLARLGHPRGPAHGRVTPGRRGERTVVGMVR